MTWVIEQTRPIFRANHQRSQVRTKKKSAYRDAALRRVRQLRPCTCQEGLPPWSGGPCAFHEMRRRPIIDRLARWMSRADRKEKETKTKPIPVILESPYAGDLERNVAYARAAMRDSLLRGEAPFASHLLYTQPGVLADDLPKERERGIEAGLAIGDLFTKTVVYEDFGLSQGMLRGVERAQEVRRPVEYRNIDFHWEESNWRQPEGLLLDHEEEATVFLQRHKHPVSWEGWRATAWHLAGFLDDAMQALERRKEKQS